MLHDGWYEGSCLKYNSKAIFKGSALTLRFINQDWMLKYVES